MQDPEGANSQATPSDSEFPTEPFACPNCGQMLAASCRVCVACHHAIDPSDIKKVPEPTPLPAPELIRARIEEAARAQAAVAPVRFPWLLFLITLSGLWLAGIGLIKAGLDPLESQLILGGVQILTSLWVFYDAHTKKIPMAVRWWLGSLLLWPVLFPWYMVRRKRPGAPCPFVEGPVGPLARLVLFVLVIVLFLLVLKGPK